MRVKSSFMVTIAAWICFSFSDSVAASISALRSLPSANCRARSSNLGLGLDGGPAPAGAPADPCPQTDTEHNRLVARTPPTRQTARALTLTILCFMVPALISSPSEHLRTSRVGRREHSRPASSGETLLSHRDYRGNRRPQPR